MTERFNTEQEARKAAQDRGIDPTTVNFYETPENGWTWQTTDGERAGSQLQRQNAQQQDADEFRNRDDD